MPAAARAASGQAAEPFGAAASVREVWQQSDRNLLAASADRQRDRRLSGSMTTDAINHDPAHMFINTGAQIAGRPSMGAWVTYGLGQAADLPGFVVLTSLGKGGQSLLRPASGAAASCRLNIKVCNCARRAIPLWIPPIPAASRATGRTARRSTRSTGSQCSVDDRRWRRASRNTRWPSRCPACRSSWT